MSFLKITDPKKRDFIVQEFLKTKKNIQQRNIAERLEESDASRDIEKFFKPMITIQKDLIKEIIPIKESIKDLPRAITFPQYPSIQSEVGSEEDQEQEQNITNIGPIANRYLRKFASKDNTDKTYGLYDKFGSFYVGDKQVDVIDNNLIVGDKEYQGSPGLWELLIMKKPDEEIYTAEDYENYAEIMIQTGSLKKDNNKPKSSKGWKWNNLLKTIWGERDRFGSGVQERINSPAIVIPSDPNALLDRLNILMASKIAGNTGVRNELVSVCDELLRQGVVDKNSYKKLMLNI